MTKKFFGIIVIAVVAIVVGWNYQQGKTDVKLSDLALANVEALADGENPFDCPNGCLTSPGQCFCHFYSPYEEAKW